MLSLEARWKKCPKTFFEVLERQNLKNQTIFELYTDDNKSKYPKDILKSAKKQQQQQKKKGSLHLLNFHSCYYWICLQNP